MRHVFVNGVQVLRDGEHTGATPGQFVRGPGWRKCGTALAFLLAGCATAPYDVIRGGTIYDGSGAAPYRGDVAIAGDRIAYVGPRLHGGGRAEIDATGLAVAPGFVNMLSWANETLIADPRSQSDIRQGVTLEVMGEGESMGPWSDAMKLETQRQGDIRYEIAWTSLGDYLGWLEKNGVSPNVASFVGATTVRVHELGEGDVDPVPAQLDRMRALVRSAMNEGAMGVGSSLIYAPAYFAETPELIALAAEAGKCGGMYISHIRDEGPKLIEAIDELVAISEASGAPAEIYHFKQSGKSNWGKVDGRRRPGRGGAGARPQDHRRHVHLRRQLDRARRGDAACGSRRAASRPGWRGSRTRSSANGRWPRCAPAPSRRIATWWCASQTRCFCSASRRRL
jgi:N-acyl-D-aspartate/D-glutamate deacylase